MPKRTMSQWAARYRIVNGAPWVNDTAPYLAVVMDAVSDVATQEVVLIAPSQSGKSELALNIVGYYSHQEPSPILFVQPTVEMAESFSKERLAGMIKETPVLKRLFGEAKSRASNNTILSKYCPGGGVDLAGANAPAGLAMRPKRVVVLDERDRHPRSAGNEGDVKAISRARTRKWRRRRKIVEISSPTDDLSSLIWPSYLEGTQEVLHLECPECEATQAPLFTQLKYQLDEDGKVMPSSVHYQCAACLHQIPATHERITKQRAQFIQTARPRVPHKRTFRVHGILAAYHSWVEICQEFVTANGQEDPALRNDMLRAFFNTTLGELYKDTQVETQKTRLLARAKRYDGGKDDEPVRFHVPRAAGYLTSGWDLQHDRGHGIIRAWGVGEQSWQIERVIMWGDTSQPEFWMQLDDYLQHKTWIHESGATLKIRAAAIDAGDGTHARKVYEFAAPRLARGVFAIRGHSNAQAPIVPSKPTKVKPGKLWVVGVNASMDRLYRRLGMDTPGPGYLNFNDYANDEYFTQLLSMRRIVDPRSRKRRWEATPGIRNEDADAENYAYIALHLGPVRPDMLAREVARVNAQGEALRAQQADDSSAVATLAPPATKAPRPKGARGQPWIGRGGRGKWLP